MEDEWIKHMHLKGGHCFEMYFTQFKRIVRFKVVGLSGGGERTAVDCETGEKFEFNITQILKIDYHTLREINCDECS